MLLAAVLLLGIFSGCGDRTDQEQEGQNVTVPAETETVVPETVPADGNPDDVTCKGTYTAEGNDNAVVASVSGRELTNSALRAYYWLEVEQYRQENHAEAPDFDRPLDVQVCQIDDSVASWQQYFLKRALNAWHSAQALVLQGIEEGVPTEPAYKPNEKNHAEYLTEKPATKWLYGYNKSYEPNEVHQAYLDSLPQRLSDLAAEKGYADGETMAREAMGTTLEQLNAAAELYNRGYMFFTSLGYDIEATQEEVEAEFANRKAEYEALGITETSGKYVDIRQILVRPKSTGSGMHIPDEPDAAADAATEETVVPAEPPVEIAADGTVTCTQDQWEACRLEAEALVAEYNNILKKTVYNALKATNEATFAELANEKSEDSGSRLNGGSYRNIRKGQLAEELDSWCFDEARLPGDMTVIRTRYGYHVLYFCASREIWYAEAEKNAVAQKQAALISTAREKYPMKVDYSAITLSAVNAEGEGISASDVLYADIAHERFPVVPLFLQQDYPDTKYGAFKITSHGCGITALAMLASYMADDDMYPPRMCEAYEDYVYVTGTDGMLFVNAPAEMGFYLKERTWEWRDAYAALEEGHIVVVVQHKGYWTRGGHYLVLEKLLEDGRIKVRDSNIYNYGRLHDHKIDSFAWNTITPKGMSYWIFEDKVTYIPACIRCGNEEGMTDSPMTEDYYCEKCRPAMLRRETYLDRSGR